VGFGVHGEGSNATVARKRTGRERIVAVTEEAVEVVRDTAIADHGDSGGPLLCGGRISGVVSCGTAAPDSRRVWYARPEQHTEWMEDVLMEWAGSED
jgi:hypothetical protein